MNNPEREHFTDLGNAQRLIRRYGRQLRYASEMGRWFAWDGKRWAPDATGQVQRFAKDTVHRMHMDAVGERTLDRQELSRWAFRSESERRLQAMVSLAKTEIEVAVRSEQLDADPWVFNVLNGTIDLRTGDLRDHDPADLITMLAPVEYDVTATSERWESFLLEIMDGRGELVRFMQRAIGYSMTGKVTEHVLLYLYGLGANGKSTFLDTILEMFGDYGCQSEPELLIRKRGESHPTGVADLKGARLVATSEIEAGKRMAESLVKQLTGGDRIKARYMRQNFFEFKPSHTLWLMANHRLVIRGTDVAIWRRIRLVPFDVTIPPDQQDATLTDTLHAEMSGILSWAVEGCLAWQREGLAAPAAVRAATQRYRAEMDVLGGFIEERCKLSSNLETPAGELYANYRCWAFASGEKARSQKEFGMRLQDRGLERFRDPKTRRFGYRGIGLDIDSVTVRNASHVDQPKSPHEETNVQTVTDGFTDGEFDHVLGGAV